MLRLLVVPSTQLDKLPEIECLAHSERSIFCKCLATLLAERLHLPLQFQQGRSVNPNRRPEGANVIPSIRGSCRSSWGTVRCMA